RLDALLLLYRAEGVPSEAVRVAVTRLRQSGANLVGAILNAFRLDRGPSGEGYYGGYGAYGYTSDDADPEESRHARRERA
ncbi:MAG: hypothetical protein AAFZ65_07445, partial [Planctomycetota bacterium]